MDREFDDAVVGGGILGLAVAHELARRGRKVVAFERHERASGASVRNFGLLWPIGQIPGEPRRLAMRSMEIWRGVLAGAGLWNSPLGSIHLAYREDEEAVLREFAAWADGAGVECEVLDPARVREKAPGARAGGLRAGLFSPTEICVDPREVVWKLPEYLRGRYGVEFAFSHCAVDYRDGVVRAGGRDWRAGRLWVCAGDEFEVLFPEAFRGLGLRRCKLQMIRTEPIGGGFKLGPILASGLTLRHYRSFDVCPSQAALRARIAAERPELDRYGIHVMATQNGRGEIVIGDSHEYGDDIDPFDKDEVEALILEQAARFLDVPGLRVASRWHGIYAKHATEPYLIFDPAQGATAVMAANGTGMTFSFGLAERAVRERLGEE